ncbi:MAG TPA: hypothetical protein DDZ81_12390 [Acetobacteraceae bacterium]|jgi:hypothetical protein|nr:hypothetical protein [Acetobacteraceae bacterium]
MRAFDLRYLGQQGDTGATSPFDDQSWLTDVSGGAFGEAYPVAGPNPGLNPVGPTPPGSAGTSTDDGLTLIGSVGSDSSRGAGSTGSGGTGTTTTSTTTSSSTGLVINITWDSSVASAPSGFQAAVLNAAQFIEANYSDPVTINVNVGYGEVGGTALGSNALGSSLTSLASVSYSTLYNALKADATTASDTGAVASLATSAPVSGGFAVTTAQAKALGLSPASGTATDGSIGFSSTSAFTYNDTNGVASGAYDFNAVAVHEFTEVMGRLLLTGNTLGTTTNYYDPLDLFHYSAPGVRDFSASTPGYFSINSGTTSLQTFNTQSGGDAGDWAGATVDAANAFATAGVVEPVSNADLTAMDVIGWNRVSTTPTGVSIAADPSGLAAAQGSGALSANVALAQVAQTGGNSADSFTYSLGGAGASAFTLASANNVGTLATGAAGVAGGTNGQLYALTLTATDTTTGNTSPASPFDVIVGGIGGDTVSVATLSGALGVATPTFVYGLAGNDVISGSSMTGKLWLDGGAGADTMTGGSGANAYLYGATSDSTSSAMDIITNFHSAADQIDLRGLGITLKYAGKIKSTSLAAESVGWQSSGGNTFVYVNTSAGTESTSAANMKIELHGGISLSSGNILHA